MHDNQYYPMAIKFIFVISLIIQMGCLVGCSVVSTCASVVGTGVSAVGTGVGAVGSAL